jgi:hypothetical protein
MKNRERDKDCPTESEIFIKCCRDREIQTDREGGRRIKNEIQCA